MLLSLPVAGKSLLFPQVLTNDQGQPIITPISCSLCSLPRAPIDPPSPGMIQIPSPPIILCHAHLRQGRDTDVATAKSFLQTAHFLHVLRYGHLSQPLLCSMSVAHPTTQAPYTLLLPNLSHLKMVFNNICRPSSDGREQTECLILLPHPCGYREYLPPSLDLVWIIAGFPQPSMAPGPF